jgi:hypothetical protein
MIFFSHSKEIKKCGYDIVYNIENLSEMCVIQKNLNYSQIRL